METIELGVEARQQTGKGAARTIRRQGKVPGVLYGTKNEAMHVAVDGKEFESKVGSIEGTHLIKLSSRAADLGGRRCSSRRCSVTR